MSAAPELRTTSALSDLIVRARIFTTAEGRRAAACWGHQIGSMASAAAAWLRAGEGAVWALEALRDDDVALARFCDGYRAECERQHAVVYVCAVCRRSITLREWNLSSPVSIPTAIGAVEQVVCPCGNGISRVVEPAGGA